MKQWLLVCSIFPFFTAFSQFNIGVGGAYQIVNAVSTFGREVVTAAQYKKQKKEQQAHEAEYMTAIQTADSLFVQAKYREAIDQYNRALQFRQDEYAINQIGRSNTELNRLTEQNYERFLDTADAAYTGLNYAEAIKYYEKALELKNEEYPRAKIERAKSRQELWKTVHFSSVLMSDSSMADLSSQAFVSDSYSNFIPPGQYPVLNGFSWGTNDQTPNGIAIPAHVRFVIYSEPYLKGKVLVDVTGPAIINNSRMKTQITSVTAHSKTFSPALQQIFPQAVRSWSANDMKEWYKGSMEIQALPSE
ncbi:tetratricopeptide repeat protein [Fluviicola sp.]|uniref:tetratricopeptide repeat protein n=1 Tax=Fluviicola sp. TaxID=1917219 RepID=UPI0031D9EF66